MVFAMNWLPGILIVYNLCYGIQVIVGKNILSGTRERCYGFLLLLYYVQT